MTWNELQGACKFDSGNMLHFSAPSTISHEPRIKMRGMTASDAAPIEDSGVQVPPADFLMIHPFEAFFEGASIGIDERAVGGRRANFSRGVLSLTG
jgi:hypothetical protein